MTCKRCQQETRPGKVYCSRECFYADTNAARIIKRWRGHVTHGTWNGKHCLGFGGKILRQEGEPSTRWKRKVYCSKNCELSSYKDEDGFSNHCGYRVITRPECCDLHRGMSHIREHVAKAEHVLGRRLRKDRTFMAAEVVHHVNGNKQDNRNSNLLICTDDYHRWLHHRMSYLYQQEHFA